MRRALLGLSSAVLLGLEGSRSIERPDLIGRSGAQVEGQQERGSVVCAPVGLMRTQKNALFERLVARGLQPAEFTLTDNVVPMSLNHSPTKSVFTLDTGNGVAYSGGMKIGDYGPYNYGSVSWGDLLTLFEQWAHNVRLEAEIPDMWEELGRARDILAQAQHENYENTPFTLGEQSEISAQLREIKAYAKKTYSLSGERLASIEARLDEAEEASQRMGRKDWLLLFSGIALTLIVTDLIPADVVQHIFTTVLHSLGHLFGGMPRPEIPPEA
jgi:hypothetical protein